MTRVETKRRVATVTLVVDVAETTEMAGEYPEVDISTGVITERAALRAVTLV